MSTVTDNGREAAPPWMTVTPEALVAQLQAQLVAQMTEMAAMRAYIDKLHRALAATVEEEKPAP